MVILSNRLIAYSIHISSPELKSFFIYRHSVFIRLLLSYKDWKDSYIARISWFALCLCSILEKVYWKLLLNLHCLSTDDCYRSFWNNYCGDDIICILYIELASFHGVINCVMNLFHNIWANTIPCRSSCVQTWRKEWIKIATIYRFILSGIFI